MKRTRRGALALMAGSATALVVDTAGFSTAQVERDVRVEVVADDEALLGLTEDGGNGGDVLFADGPGDVPATFDVINQTAGEVTVEMELDVLEFDHEAVSSDDEPENTLHAEGVGPGEAIEDVEIGIPGSELDGSNSVSDTIHFHVEGDGLQIDAERTVELEPEEIETSFELRRGNSGGNEISGDDPENGTDEDDPENGTGGAGNRSAANDSNDEGKTSVDVDVTLVSGGTDSVWATVEYESDSGSEVLSGVVDDERTFRLDDIGPGNWNADPDDVDPGGRRTVADTPVTVEVDPAATGDDPVTVTVSVGR